MHSRAAQPGKSLKQNTVYESVFRFSLTGKSLKRNFQIQLSVVGI